MSALFDDTTMTALADVDWSRHPRFAGVQVKMAHGRVHPGEFSQMLVRLDPRGGEIPPHTHEGLDECFVILTGRGQALIRGERLDLGPHTSIYAPEGAVHGMRNDGDDELLLLATFVPSLIHCLEPFR
jgi:mannose-6-phosphate isomerase-like protein (cupin superfamily)